MVVVVLLHAHEAEHVLLHETKDAIHGRRPPRNTQCVVAVVRHGRGKGVGGSPHKNVKLTRLQNRLLSEAEHFPRMASLPVKAATIVAQCTA